MLEQIKKRIAGISSEVDELHPLLAELFRNHQKILHFEHTHGLDEMGADFVLTHSHDVLGTTEYIGVVAKRGKIHLNLDDVERQIRECTRIPRKVDNGKKEVVLSQVWVIATGNITRGAKEKIHAEYPGTNVHFVDGGDLSSMVAEYVPSYRWDIDLPVSNYLSSIKARSEELDKSFDLMQLEGEPIYIGQDVERVEIDPYGTEKHKKSSKHKRVDILKELSENRLMLIEAHMGGGKSKLLRKLTQHYADVATFIEEKVLPVHATFKELVDDYGGDLHKLCVEKVPCEVRETVGQDADYLFLIDAVDEKDMLPEELSKIVASLADKVDEEKHYRLVLTSRHIASIDFDKRLLYRLGRYEIAPLTMGKIFKFLEAICRKLDLQSRIIEDLQRSHLFDKLPRNPIAAVLLGQLLAENQQELPSTMTELYQKYMELALGRWTPGKGCRLSKNSRRSKTC